jgi:hypothetical protein
MIRGELSEVSFAVSKQEMPCLRVNMLRVGLRFKTKLASSYDGQVLRLHVKDKG